ncbi:hypothetical protein SAMN05216359_11831 [Roseateles sp. YR242]|uniref:hypothetical protein n=1 Tax=Roseateles sp. YR242 TaxID=1855305 RepID=UPI0008AE383C|nr:hypothetical protein [Roseateles sp. YR242]SEL81976.1 hypothetical protein SAMN05216359_11831 [Roseateles sp. YR242]
MMSALRLVMVMALAGLPTAWAASVDIHPAGPTVPENLLRIELRFSQPQHLPFDTRRLTLLDESGVEIRNAVLDLALPSPDGRRITVLMDPGRVKRGVGPNLDAGRALTPGRRVSLRVADAGLRGPAVVKQWEVSAANERPLDVAAWTLHAPRAHSQGTLVLNLHAPISSTAEALIAVVDGDGRRIPGRGILAGDDAVWRFTPSQPWKSAPYAVVTHPDLEDAAGNRACAAFEQMRGSVVACDTGVRMNFSPAGASRPPGGPRP